MIRVAITQELRSTTGVVGRRERDSEWATRLAVSCLAQRTVRRRNSVETNTRRNFLGKITAMAALLTGAPTPGSASMTGGDPPRRPGGNRTLNGIYYFSGTGANDG